MLKVEYLARNMEALAKSLDAYPLYPPAPPAEAERALRLCRCEEHDYCDETCYCKGVARK